jgi:hypothetical protein
MTAIHVPETRSGDGKETKLTETEERAFLEAVQTFSDYHLPCRGWLRVLEVGAAAGGIGRARVLAERGHDVTLVDRDEATLVGAARQLAEMGVQATFVPASELGGNVEAFDAVSCFDPAAISYAPGEAAMMLRRRLRHYGLLIGGPAFLALEEREIHRAGFKHGPYFGTRFSLQAAHTFASIGFQIGLWR